MSADPEIKPSERTWFGLPLVVLVCGVVLTLFGWRSALQLEEEAIRGRVGLEAEQRALAFRERLNLLQDSIYSVQALFHSSEGVSPEEFRIFAGSYLSRHPEVRTLTYEPRVPHAERAAFEARARASGLAGFSISDRDAHDELVPAAEREVYFPVFYAEPPAVRKIILGFDAGHGAVRRAAVERTQRTGAFSVTAPISLIKTGARRDGFLALLPIQRGDELQGLVIGAYRTMALIDASLAAFQPDVIQVDLYDVTDPEPVEMACQHSSEVVPGYEQISAFEFGGRAYRIRSRPTRAFVDTLRSWLPLGTLVGGCGFSILVSTFLMFWIRHARRVEALVARGRAELEQRVAAEESLRVSEERLSLTLNSVSDGGWDWDLARDHVTFSEAWLRSLGYAAGELPPTIQSWDELVHPEDRARVLAAREEHLAGARSHFECEHRLRTRDGRYRPNLGRAKVVLRGPGGEPLRVVGTDTDISERKQAEAEQAVLAGRVQEVQKLESLGLVVGGVAHDFNNLLTGILGSAQIAKELCEGGGPVYEFLDQIELSGTRAAELTREMLAYAGRGTFALSDADLSQIAREMPQLVGASLSKKAQLRQELDEEAWARVDASQLRQVVMNLLINASDALEGQAGEIVLRTGVVELSEPELRASILGSKPDSGRFAYVEVEDTGRGMSAEVRERMFDPFFSTKAKGRGLGLAAVIGIVRWHEGAITVDSEPGRGTRVRVLLPALGAAVEALGADPAPPASPAPGPLSGTALVVDDEASVRKVVVSALRLLGLESLEAENGRVGLELFRARQGEVALTITDLTMPEMNGVELGEAIRELAPELPLVVLSGHAEPQDLASIPGVTFVSKPFKIAEFLGTIRGVLGSDRVR